VWLRAAACCSVLSPKQYIEKDTNSHQVVSGAFFLIPCKRSRKIALFVVICCLLQRGEEI